MTGGNCWDGSAKQFVQAEEPTELTELDKIIDNLCPNISYMKFRKINEIVQTTTKNGGGDYYGNYYDYTVKYIILKDLYQKLVELEII